MKIFGKTPAEGSVHFDDGRMRGEALVRTHGTGYRVSGTIRGKAGRIEVYRAPAPRRLLINNWQSWGPMQAMDSGGRIEGVAERMANYSRTVFSPVPDVFSQMLVSDYFLAWENNVVGFLSSRVAHPYFAVEGDEIAGYLEYFGTDLTDSVPLEPFVVLPGDSIAILLEHYADLTALENKVRVPDWNPVGWSSWYQYFTHLTAADVEKNLRLAGDGFPFEVFQIDDGFEADIGDWLRPKDGFPPPADLARLIRDRGFTAGIWTAPFSASESSELFRLHPDWFVTEDGRPKPCCRNWNKTIYALDTTHPGAKQWLFDTFVAFRRMGYSYFKIDFLFAAAMPGTRRVPVTPLQAYREGMAVIRRAVKGEFILGCGAPLLPSLGFVEGMRVGEDTAPFWNPRMSGVQGPNAYIALKNPILRAFMHKRWWLNDPDCLLLREQDIELSINEKALYARVAGVLDSMLIDSDDLELVDERGRALLAEAVRLKGGRPRVRGLLEDDLYIIESTHGPAPSIRFAANLSEMTKVVEGRGIAPRSGVFLDTFTGAKPRF